MGMQSVGFQNPIAGQQGSLILSQIKSPNYVAGTTGWQIAKDGTAEFNTAVVRGSVVGTEYILNSEGLFLYSGAPAFGNLYMSMASVAGTDQYGNNYGSGFRVYTSTPGIANVAVDLHEIGVLNANAVGSTLAIDDGQTTNTTTPELVGTVNNSLGYSVIQPYATGSGVAWTSSPIAGIQPGTTITPETWHSLTLQAGFGQPAGTYATPRIRFEPTGTAGVYRLGGAVAITANTAAGALIANLPYTPAKSNHFTVPTLNGNQAIIDITNVGTLTLLTAGTAGDTVFLSGTTVEAD